MLETLYVRAYPKINAVLKVNEKVGKLHSIQSRFNIVLEKIFDEMLFCILTADDMKEIIRNTKDFKHELYTDKTQAIECVKFYLYGNFDCTLEANLIYRAYKILYTFYKENKQKKLPNKMALFAIINKQIPVGGGLGGGSVNAAITLLVLNKILSFNYDLSVLLECAKKLGSDVAFFIKIYTQEEYSIHSYFMESIALKKHDIINIMQSNITHSYISNMLRIYNNKNQATLKYTSANVYGTGDIIEPFYEKYMNLLIHCNDVSCDTKKVYEEFAKINIINTKSSIDFNKNSIELLSAYSINELNDLYKPACNLYDKLIKIEEQLCKIYSKVYFSGSGSSFFSIKA